MPHRSKVDEPTVTVQATIDPNNGALVLGEPIATTERVTPKEGVKNDAGKTCRPELIPPEAVEALGTVLAFGAKKYADRNWELGMNWSRCYGAAMRHLWAWWSGKDKDEETGYSHLYHALTCIAFLVAYEERKIGKDDRP